MRCFAKLSGLLLLLLLSVTACKSYQWSGSSSVSCNGHFIGSTTQCTITFTSAKQFNWTASSIRSNDPTHLWDDGCRDEFREYSCHSPLRWMSRHFRHLHRLLKLYR